MTDHTQKPTEGSKSAVDAVVMPPVDDAQEKHRQRHIELHRGFDELLADWIANTKEPPLNRPVKELIEWSYLQTCGPDHEA